MSFKDFLPPVVVDFVKKNQTVKTYENYEAALLQCSHDAYQNEELCNVIADKTIIYVEQLKKKPYGFNSTTIYLAFALNYFANVVKKQAITVLDFGGACGGHYHEIRNIIPATISLNWIVVETKQMIKSAVSRGFAKGELSFVEQIEDYKGEIDFIHSSSALQYVPSPYTYLKRLVDIKAKMILFNRMMFNEKDYDIITVQRSFLSSNGPGKLPEGYTDRQLKYVHTTMADNHVNSIMVENGYERFSEFNESSGSFLLGKEKILGKGLLYIKK